MHFRTQMGENLNMENDNDTWWKSITRSEVANAAWKTTEGTKPRDCLKGTEEGIDYEATTALLNAKTKKGQGGRGYKLK